MEQLIEIEYEEGLFLVTIANLHAIYEEEILIDSDIPNNYEILSILYYDTALGSWEETEEDYKLDEIDRRKIIKLSIQKYRQELENERRRKQSEEGNPSA